MSSFALLGVVIVLAVIGFTYLVARGFGTRARGYRAAVPAWQRALPVALFAGALACVVLAVLQFRVNQEAVQGTVILTLDVSNSMDETDVEPTRMVAAEEAVRSFLETLPSGFPVGLVTFATEATVVQPPVDDRSLIADRLGSLERGLGTVIGDGLSLSIDQLVEDRELNGVRPAAVVLLSDGLDTGSEVPPLVAADRAAQLGIPVYTVVLGDPAAEKGPDAGLLQDIATRTDASSSSALTAAELEEVYSTLGSQLSTELAIEGAGPLFIVLGVLLAIGAAAMLLLGGRSRFD
jgi:Ca-activated chloride channel homolog